MNSIICTLFENHYHYGLATLVNSLYYNGFRGEIYAGYKGELPPWILKAKPNVLAGWPGSSTLTLGEGLQLHFLPVSTDNHLTNYKPDFMIELLNGPASGADAILYFDPDIILIAAWVLIENWLKCGVALCEDVNSPIPEHHPKRFAWRQFYAKKGIALKFKDAMYVNGGFVGVQLKDRAFLDNWKIAQDHMASAIGGLGYSMFSYKKLSDVDQSCFSPFGRTDQDALNVAVEMTEMDISFVGQEMMAFKPGEAMLPHALGAPKPWQRKPLKEIFFGMPPRSVDKEYWRFASGLINLHSEYLVKKRRRQIKLASLLGRFYTKR